MQWALLTNSVYIFSETEQVTLQTVLAFTSVHAHQRSKFWVMHSN